MGATYFSAAVAYARTLLKRNGGVFLPAGVVLIVAAVAAVGGTIWELRADALEEARRDTANLALILADQSERSVQAIDLVVRELQDEITAMKINSPDAFEKALGNESTHSLLASRRERISQADALILMSARGTPVNTSRFWPSVNGTDFSDRDYIAHFREDLSPHAFISAPVKNRVTGTWTIYLARSINSPDRKFIGLVLAAVDLRYFQQIFDAIDLPRHEVFTLLRRDGTVLFRHPDTIERAGMMMKAETPWYGQVAKGGGTYLSLGGGFDGHQRMITAQPFREYPLVLNVGVTEEAALAEWRNQTLFMFAAALVLLAYAGFMMRMVRRQFRRLRESEASLTVQNDNLVRLSAELGSSEARLAEKSRVLETTLATMDQGLLMIDPDGKIVRFNKRAAKLLALPEEFLASQPALAEVVDYQWQKNLCGREAASFEEFAAPQMVLDRPNFRELRWPDGRVVEMRSVPRPDGGAVRTYTDITQRKRAEERTHYFAHHDDLTRLVNRAVFRKRLEEAIALASSDRRGLAVFYLDLDRFKQVNDSRGHEVGDRVLVEVAKRMRGAVRSIDTLARIGGDEFAAILPFMEDPEAAIQLAQRLIDLVASPIVIDIEASNIGVSIGIALFPQHGLTIDALLRHADRALYEAKHSGRNTFCINASAAMQAAADQADARGAQSGEAEAAPQDYATGQSK
jgi:diguanylate cyclase (GGDEF)-like protein